VASECPDTDAMWIASEPDRATQVMPVAISLKLAIDGKVMAAVGTRSAHSRR